MSFDFNHILIQHGFSRKLYDFEPTIVGFDYDIQFSLFDAKTVFDTDRSRIYRQWNNPNAFIRCELVISTGNIGSGVRYLLERWSTELRYKNPIREIIDYHRSATSAVIRVLTISQYNAMTILFNITRG